MKLTQTNKLLTIELEDNEEFADVEQKLRNIKVKNIQVWIKIETK